ncbi:MAG: glucosamine-6-phosphate deaminase [Actinobacteria bacterium]|nr:MAG: glucosamine-6-phosphate deaminase [Actinomycetota bacterium]
MLEPVVLGDSEAVGAAAAAHIARTLKAGPRARILLPTGSTPGPMYAALRRLAAGRRLASHRATPLQLDEYVGVCPEDPRSFSHFLSRELRGIEWARPLVSPRGDVDPERAARRHAAHLAEPVALAVLGIGINGHVAFNEPGSLPAEPTRVVRLTRRTRERAATAFGGLTHVPTRAITVGLRELLAADELLLLATGAAKREALAYMLAGPFSPSCPASLLRRHPRLTVLADRAAAGGTQTALAA